jgi:uncharacterized OB-fold protein
MGNNAQTMERAELRKTMILDSRCEECGIFVPLGSTCGKCQSVTICAACRYYEHRC